MDMGVRTWVINLMKNNGGMVATREHFSVCSPTASNVSSGLEALDVHIKEYGYHV